MTRELGATSRALVTAAREGLAPDAATAARVRAKIAAATASPAGSAGLAWKLAAACSVVAAIVATRAVVHRGDVPAPAFAAPTASTDDIDVRPAERIARAETAPAAHARSIEHAPVVVEAAPAEPPSLAREVELVDRAMLALRNADADGALATIAIFERETADRGQLAEDATAIAIEAHCRRGDAVTDTLAAFDARWPSSAQRARLTAACRR